MATEFEQTIAEKVDINNSGISQTKVMFSKANLCRAFDTAFDTWLNNLVDYSFRLKTRFTRGRSQTHGRLADRWTFQMH